MKKIKYLVLTLVMSLFGINNVFASQVTVSAQYDSTEVPKGSEFFVMVNVRADVKLGSCIFKVSDDSNLELVSKTGANGWSIQGDGADGILMEASNFMEGGTDVSAGLNVLSLKYKANGDGKVVVETTQCIDTSVADTADGRYKNIETVEVSFATVEPAKDTTLKAINVVNGSMSPSNVVAGRLKYIVNLFSSDFGLEFTTTDEKYQNDIKVKTEDGTEISDLSNITYNDPNGKGQMLLYVTIGGETTYELDVVYEKKDYDNSLDWVAINDEKIKLQNGVYSYVVTVGKDVSSVTVAAALKDNENFKIDDNSPAPGLFSLNDTVTALIVIKPKDASTGAKAVTYEIEIVREGSDDSNNETPPPPTNNGNNVNKNPTTSDMPMVMMAAILVVSLVGSVILYRKNAENYK